MTVGFPLIRRRWWVVAAWLAGCVGLGLLVGPLDPAANERESFLPAETPYSRATAAMRESFPHNSGLAEAVVIFERPAAMLSAEDFQAVERLAQRIGAACSPGGKGNLAGVQVRSPRSVMLPGNPLISGASERGQAALIVVSIPANFITIRSSRVVDLINGLLAEEALPGGLKVAVTGNAGFGRDYADAAEKSHRKTVYVTLVAVIVILLIVYRAPAAAMVPLAAISIAAFVALKVLAAGQHFGMHIGMAERIFVIVLLYGAGTDYSLFFISRFREFLDEQMPALEASGRALDATLPAILASAGTDTAGLLMLCFADYGIFRTTGPAVAVALLTALLAAVTLVPAGAAIIGSRLFWPGKVGADKLPRLGRKRLWPRLARLVTGRPRAVLVVSLIALAVPAFRGVRLTWVYDTLTELKKDPQAPVGNAAVGLEMARRHWPVGQIAPVHVLVRSARPRTDAQWQQFSQKVTRTLSQLAGVQGIRSLSRPLGREPNAVSRTILATVGRPKVLVEYLSEDRRATRLAVLLDSPAFSLKAMKAAKEIRHTVEATVEQQGDSVGINGQVHIAGATAEMMDIRAVTQADFYRVAALSLCVIYVMVVVLLRDAVLAAFMVASTVLSYFATLGAAFWVFTGLLGHAGLDWKVEVFLFVVMVAVGVDYNIFLASRLSQEARRLPGKLAICRAVIHTGPVISSCGLIMAATLGSLMAGDLTLLHQLGFALALGMLIDSFLVRPLLLPAFAALSGRTGRALDLGAGFNRRRRS